MGSEIGASSASDMRARQAQEEAARRIREQQPVRLEPTPPLQPIRIGGVYVPPFSDTSLQQVFGNRDRPPPALADLKLYTKDLLEREVDTTRARAASKPGPEGDTDRFALTRLEGELATRNAPKLADLTKLETTQALDREILEEQIFLRKYASKAPPDVVHQHQQQLAALNEKRADVLERDSACDNAKTPTVDHLPEGRPYVSVTADDLIARINRQMPMSVFQEDALRKAFNAWRLDTCRTTGIDPTTVRSSNDRRLGVDHFGLQEEAMRQRVEMFMASSTSVAASLAFVDSAMRGDTLEAAHARVMAASTHGDLASTLPVPGGATSGVAPDMSVRADHTHVEGLAQKITDEATMTGHAANTRFRGVDNRAYERDSAKITYGPFRVNPNGQVRSVEQAREIYERTTGRKLPPWIKLVVDRTVPGSKNAEYKFGNGKDLKARFGQEYDLETDGMTVRIRPETLESDEAIVCTLRHETFELETLNAMSKESNMTWGDVLRAINDEPRSSNKAQNLHGDAWDVGDMEVLLMRAQPGTPEHALLLKRRDMLMTRLANQHGVDP